MPLVTPDMIVGSIVEMGVQTPIEAAYSKAKRTETVIKLLKKLNISHEPERDDFEGMYRFALVEWGVFKPAAVVGFFRDKTVQETFAAGFRSSDFSGWLAQSEGAYETYLRQQGAIEYDPRRELEDFLAVFHAIVDRTDTPAGMRRTQSLDALHDKVDAILGLAAPQPTAQELAAKLTPYLETVVRQTRRLPLGPLDPSGRENTQLALDAVFINLNAEVWQAAALLPGKQQKQHTRYAAALGHIHREERLILLGDPGSGKSTLLYYLAFCLAQAQLDPDGQWLKRLSWVQEELVSDEAATEAAWQKVERERLFRLGREEEKEPGVREVTCLWEAGALVPVLVPLRDFAQTTFVATSPTAVWEFIAHRLRDAHLEEAVAVLQWQAQRGQLFFLLDGVDEVPIDVRPRVWQAIEAMEKGVYGGNRWVATCRKLSFEAGGAPTNAAVQTLQGLTEAQIEQFVTRWYEALVAVGEMNAAQAKGKVEVLQAAARRPRLQELAGNPMLLTIMAVVQTYGTLPDERAKLYQQCVETLLLRWQRHKESHTVTELPGLLAELGATQEKLERLLWEIAWEAHSGAAEREDAADIPESKVVQIARKHLGDWGRAGQFVQYTEERAHLLVGRGGGDEKMFAFPHRTFQEYLAACQLAFSERRLGRQAAKLAAEGDTWREVLNLVAGALTFVGKTPGKVMDVVEDMLPTGLPAADDVGGWRRVWLGGEMVLVPGLDFVRQDEVGQEILPRLQTLLGELVTNGVLPPPQRAAAGVVLGWLGDERADVAAAEPEMVPVAAGSFLLGSDKGVDEWAFDGETPQHERWLPDYAIGKYPVTVAQFGCFVADGGYTERWRRCWTAAGWQWREANEVTEPRLWHDATFAVPNQPVVGVSWYEAVAYCGWLRATTGRAFRLPDEAMWEKAASWVPQAGDPAAGVKRRYPWGDAWDPARLNAAETRIGQPTAVGLFPTGRSFYGAYDMAGNVWEWCSGAGVGATPYPFKTKVYAEEIADEAQFRALRGGAFGSLNQYCRAASRYNYYPGNGNDAVGFRVAEHLSDPGS
ncbi:MAG: SUMF1/EgtB/PvdO family nonheme iron enzyme [Anaerolineales bacterium]|nr:SUMF1/EgtB/PvdO family nonheme iron enzyme [Anaerolineales bacterium]